MFTAPGSALPFLQLPSSKHLTISAGAFQTGTGTLAVAGTGDWAVVGPSTGIGNLTFPTRTAIPLIVATIQTAGAINGYAEVSAWTTGTAQIATLNGATAPPVLANAIVSFIVIG